jgi:hypothetical protein
MAGLVDYPTGSFAGGDEKKSCLQDVWFVVSVRILTKELCVNIQMRDV